MKRLCGIAITRKKKSADHGYSDQSKECDECANDYFLHRSFTAQQSSASNAVLELALKWDYTLKLQKSRPKEQPQRLSRTPCLPLV
jgi:hypothetical protein